MDEVALLTDTEPKLPARRRNEFETYFFKRAPTLIALRTQLLEQSPTFKALYQAANLLHKHKIDTLILAGAMFSNGKDALEATKIAIARLFEFQLQVKIAAEFELKRPVNIYSNMMAHPEKEGTRAEAILTLAVEAIAKASELNPNTMPQEALAQAEVMYKLATGVLKPRIIGAFENPQNDLPVIASINASADALRDCSLYFRYPDLYTSTANFLQKKSKVLPYDLYDVEFATGFARQTIEHVCPTIDQQVQVIGNFKCVTSLLYELYLRLPPKSPKLAPLSPDWLPIVANWWRKGNSVHQALGRYNVLADVIRRTPDRIRTRIACPDLASMQQIIDQIENYVATQKGPFKFFRNKTPISTSAWLSSYPENARVHLSSIPLPNKAQAAKTIAQAVRQQLEQRTICYAGYHANCMVPTGGKADSFVPFEFDLWPGQYSLSALYDTGSKIRKVQGEGAIVPAYKTFMAKPKRLISAALEAIKNFMLNRRVAAVLTR